MKPRICVLAGPTASGKTALGLELAERLQAEIISADSQQVYRGLDLGTAKPTAAERARVPHHLLDFADLDTQVTAADFAERADAAIERIHARGLRVLVVGGTGLWIRALLRGLAPAPARDPALRAQLEAELARDGSPAMHARLARVDPPTAERLHPNDQVRIVRALEVHALSGERLSDLQAAHRFSEPRYPHRMLALDVPRETLRARIRTRAEAMLGGGWIEETQRLLAQGHAARLEKVLGYSEVADLLEGRTTREDTLERIVARTWQYARRQRVWLRGESDVRWLESGVEAGALAEELAAWWGRPLSER